MKTVFLILKKASLAGIFLALPFLFGWQNINVGEYLSSVRSDRKGLSRQNDIVDVPLPDFRERSPFRIMEKATAVFNSLHTVRVSMETWIEDSSMHIKSSLVSDIRNMDDHKTCGRIGISFLSPGGVSTSQWVQSYQIRGIPFVWDMEKREWVEKELEITGKDSKKIIQYTVLSSLFNVNDAAIDISTLRLCGKEERAGRDCFVLFYKLAPKQFERWATSGEISVKLWIDTTGFFPVCARSEGKIGSLYILQAVSYSRLNVPVDFDLPDAVSEKVSREKNNLRDKVPMVVNSVARIRRTDTVLETAVEFVDRTTMRAFLCKELDKSYSSERFKKEEALMKWFALLPPEADYRESLINSRVAATAAVYDPESKKILLGDWIHPVMAEVVLAHELTHAFQDATLNLKEFLSKGADENNLDLYFAGQSLLEGEAVAVMLEYMLNKDNGSFTGAGDIFTFIEETLFKKSQYIRENLVYNIYGYGANFIQDYLKRKGWESLDALYKLPPVSMKQIMHPYLYGNNTLQQEGWDIKVDVPASWKQMYEVRAGEFFLLLSLRQYLDKALSEMSSSGWKNDSVIMFEDGPRRLIVFVTQWDNPSEAAEFLDAYTHWIIERYPDVSRRSAQRSIFFNVSSKDEKFFCVSDNDTVRIIWSDGLRAAEFANLINKIGFNF